MPQHAKPHRMTTLEADNARAVQAQAAFSKRQQAQIQYSKRLAENQAARLAKSNAAFQAQQQQFIRENMHTEGQTLASLGLLVGMIVTVMVIASLAAQRKRPRHSTSAWTPPPTAAPKPASTPVPSGQYRTAASLLTPTEQRFHNQLRAVVGTRATIQCKVRLADLLLSERHDLAAFRRVSQKHIDFVLCHPQTLRPLVAVELDDASHTQPDRQARDAFVNQVYAAAGMPLLHVPVSGHYDLAYIHALVEGYLPAATTPSEGTPRA